MKQLILISLFLITNSCDGQEKKVVKKHTITYSSKKKTMDNFMIDKYKDWEIDTTKIAGKNDTFLMKGDDRVRIITNEEKTIQVEKSSIISPYKIVTVYSFKNKNLLNLSKDFYSIPISYEKYDENGKIIEEKDYNKPYKFTIEDLVEKIKKEYKINLGDGREGSAAGRTAKEGVFYYEVYLKPKVGESMEYLLIHGTTGETILKSDFHVTP